MDAGLPLHTLGPQLRDALSHLHDLGYLEGHPLANLASPSAASEGRGAAPGRAVQQYLLESLEALRRHSAAAGKHVFRGYRLLALRYAEGLDAPSVQAELAIGKSEYYREHQRALEALASLLLARGQPDDQLRLEAGQVGLGQRSIQPGLPDNRAPDRELGPTRIRDGSARGTRHDLAAVKTLDGPELAMPLASFVGRERELREVEALLRATRLLTLTGPGGVGKTRLALELARRVAGAYPDGVRVVELGAFSDASTISRVVASALGLLEEGEQPIDLRLERCLWPRSLLLVLDNCEHLLEAIAALAERLLTRCPRLQILATSREALRIGGEVRWRVPALTTPPDDICADSRELARYEAVALFVERARAVSPDFALSEANAARVGQICARLDGIPLGVELAAARVGSLSVEQIARRLDGTVGDRFVLLTEGSRTAAPRQRTLRASLDWSHDLLDPKERVVLRRLSAFESGFSLEAAEAVCQGGEVAAREVAGILGKLVDKSLIQVDQVAGEPRYRLPRTIRAYAWERLVEAGESDRAGLVS